MPTNPAPAVLYPDVVARGGLAAVLQAAAVDEGLSVLVTPSDSPDHALVPTAVAHREDLRVTTSRVERRFSIWGTEPSRGDVLHKGLPLITGGTTDLAQVARAMQAWHDGVALAEITRIAPFVELTGRFEVPDRDPAQLVDSEWQYLRKDAAEADRPRYRALIEAAYAVPRLRQLYPYTSHWALNVCLDFSCRRYLPEVHTLHSSYVVLSPCRVLIGETATPERALELVLSWLPDDAGPALPDGDGRAYADPLWAEAERRCDPDNRGTTRRFWIADTTTAHWQALFDVARERPKAWLYTEGGVERDVPTAAEVFARPAHALPAVLGRRPDHGEASLLFRPTTPNQIEFTAVYQAPPGRWLGELVNELTDLHFWLRKTHPGPILMASRDDPHRAVLALRPMGLPLVQLL